MGNFRDGTVVAVDKAGKKRRVPESWLNIKSFGFSRPPSQKAKQAAPKKTDAKAEKAKATDSPKETK